MLNRSLFFTIALFVTLLLSLATTQDASAQSTPSEATRLLKQRSAEFERDVIPVTDGVYTAVGYSVQPVTMIVGDEGLIIVDTGMDTPSAEQVLADFRKISDKPIAAVILTHSHGDHTGGLSVFTRLGHPQVWARDTFGAELNAMSSVGLTINNVRGARQGGFKLPPEKRINNGVAQAYWPKRGGAVFGSKKDVKPTHLVKGPRQRISIAGVDLDLVAATGETYDHLYVWFPARRVLFSGDNYYKSWPNLYPIRGAPYRDILAWADAIDTMLQEEPDFLVPGHTRPIIGKEKVTEALTDYRDAIRFVFTKTIEGMNKGLTPDELVDYVQLPKRFQGKDNLRPYYGDPEWAVRAIFTAHLGWFDGNPSNLFPLNPREEAERVAKLAGGEKALLEAAKQAMAENDPQWTAQLCDHLLALDPNAKESMLLKADALEAIAITVLSAIGRNYYLTVAQELRQAAK